MFNIFGIDSVLFAVDSVLFEKCLKLNASFNDTQFLSINFLNYQLMITKTFLIKVI